MTLNNIGQHIKTHGNIVYCYNTSCFRCMNECVHHRLTGLLSSAWILQLLDCFQISTSVCGVITHATWSWQCVLTHLALIGVSASLDTRALDTLASVTVGNCLTCLCSFRVMSIVAYIRLVNSTLWQMECSVEMFKCSSLVHLLLSCLSWFT